MGGDVGVFWFWFLRGVSRENKNPTLDVGKNRHWGRAQKGVPAPFPGNSGDECQTGALAWDILKNLALGEGPSGAQRGS